MRRRVSVTGPSEVATAWERYLFPARWAEWAPQIRAVECTAERIAPGVSGVVRGPAGLAIPFRVLEVDDAARAWRWSVTAAGIRVVMHHDLAATPDGTVAGLTMDGPAVVVLGYGPVARLALRRLVATD